MTNVESTNTVSDVVQGVAGDECIAGRSSSMSSEKSVSFCWPALAKDEVGINVCATGWNVTSARDGSA